MTKKKIFLLSDIATIIVSAIAQFKFESKYWLVKGSSVNKSAGFGDIFHDWVTILFFAIPLLAITQLTISYFSDKIGEKKVFISKIIAFFAVLLFVNKKKIMAELVNTCRWDACIFLLTCTILYGIFLYVIHKYATDESKITNWYIPLIGAIIGIGATYLI